MKKRRKILLVTCLILGVTVLSTAIFSFAILEPNIHIFGWETLDDSKLFKPDKTVTFLDAFGEEIESKVYSENKKNISVTDLPKHTVDAFVSIEDKRFYDHHGVDYFRIFGAIFNNIKSMSFKEGASTISQQLIKNTHLNADKKISRKIKEIRIAKELERKYTKDEIMQMYLNVLYFGDNMYGINTAAKMFFDREPSELTLSQSALLAGVINNPSKYNPYRNPENALERRNLVLKRMFEAGKIDEDTYTVAVGEPIGVCEKGICDSSFVNTIVKDMKNIFGSTASKMFTDNITVQTYFRPDLQAAIKDILLSANTPDGSDGHIIIMENEGGSIICDETLSAKNLTYLKRQPGSTIKPLLCYAPLLENGSIYTCSPIEDAPTSFDDYAPSNYKNKYFGWVTAKDALAHSLNIPAVKLLRSGGIDYCKSVCEKTGIEFHENDNHLALALGGMTSGVTLSDLVRAYRVFAVEGKYVDGSCIKSVVGKHGETLYNYERYESQALSRDTAFLMTDMLLECAQTGTAKRLADFGNVCAKTGTVGSKDGNSDLYCIAYSPTYTVGVWVGNTDKKMPNEISSGNLACGMAAEVFKLLKDDASFVRPKSIACRYIDNVKLKDEHTVMLAGEDVPMKDKKCEWFSETYMPSEYSTPRQWSYFDYDELLNFDFENFRLENSMDR